MWRLTCRTYSQPKSEGATRLRKVARSARLQRTCGTMLTSMRACGAPRGQTCPKRSSESHMPSVTTDHIQTQAALTNIGDTMQAPRGISQIRRLGTGYSAQAMETGGGVEA
jgi:hypothetical protein